MYARYPLATVAAAARAILGLEEYRAAVKDRSRGLHVLLVGTNGIRGSL